MRKATRGSGGRLRAPVIALLVSVIASLTVVSTASAANGLLAAWGPVGTGDGQVRNPNGIAVDAAGNVYVADTFNHRIQKFTTNGAFLRKWGSFGGGDGQFSRPRGIEVDAAGNVYVADSGNKRIQKFTTNGAFLGKWGLPAGSQDIDGIRLDGEFVDPTDVEIDAAGNVLVTDLGNVLQKFTPGGGFLDRWDQTVSVDGQFNWLYGVAADPSGNVYLSEAQYNNRIQKFTSGGAFLGQWGSLGTGPGQFNDPRGIAVDAAGNVYVVDSDNYRVQKFTPSGAFLGEWGSKGRGEGQFRVPEQIAIDGSGAVYIVDALNDHGVKKFDPAAAIAAGPGAPPGQVLAPATALVVGNKVLLTLRCPGSRTCAGKVTLATSVKSGRRGRTSSAAADQSRKRKRSRRKILIGKAGYKIPAGKRKTVRVLLTRKGRLLLRRRGKRGLRVRVGGRRVKNRTVTLRLKRRKRP